MLLILVLGFTVGVGYGVFNLDFDNISETTTVATVTDTAFPEIHEVVVPEKTKTTSYSSYKDDSSYNDVETTQDSSYSSDYSSSSSSGYNSYDSDYSSQSGSESSSSDSSYNGGSSSDGSQSGDGVSEEY